MCVDGEPRTQRQGEFKRRMSCQQWTVLQHEATGVRDGINEENTAVKVMLIDAMSIMVRAMNPAGHGCAERARRSR
jgi:hypothetical protein